MIRDNTDDPKSASEILSNFGEFMNRLYEHINRLDPAKVYTAIGYNFIQKYSMCEIL